MAKVIATTIPPYRLWEVLQEGRSVWQPPGHEDSWPASELRRAWKAEVVLC